MKTPRPIITCTMGALALSLLSCMGDSGGLGPSAGIDGTGIKSGVSVGAVTGFGSVIVNDVRYDTSNANILVDGQVGTEADLAIGDVVIITGPIDVDGETGTAESINVDDSVQGPVAFVDFSTSSFVVLGQIVNVFVETSFDDSFEPASLDALQIDDVVEVSGFVDSNGNINATRIERKRADAALEVTGIVSLLDTSNSRFSINALVVNFSAAMLEDFASGAVNDGDLVEVVGNSVSDTSELVATRLRFRGGDVRRNPGDNGQIQGFVTRFMSTTDFEVSGVPVVTTSETEFVNDDISALTLNSKLEVEGEFDANGVLVVTRVIFQSFTAFGNLHFEPNNGLEGAGLLTDHGLDPGLPPLYDYRGRIDAPGCANTVRGEWFIDAGQETIGNTRVIRATGEDLIVDIFNANMFDGCFGASSVDNGLLELSLRTVDTSCEAQFKWNFGYANTSTRATEYFSMESIGWMPLEPPFDDCGQGGSNKLQGDFNFWRNTVEDGVTTRELLDSVTLDFFVVFHLCPGGTGC